MNFLLAALLSLPASAGDPAPAPASAVVKPAGKAKPKRVLPGEDVSLITRDGWTLNAKYVPAKENQYTFVLLHNGAGRKEDWYFLAKAMQRRGVGMLAPDLRGHGTSVGAPPGQPDAWRKFVVTKQYNEWNNMSMDVEAAVAYLKEKNVPETSIALGGGDVGASLALRYAAVHKQAPFLFMLSPGMAYREVLTINAMRAYAERPVLMIVANDDKRSTAETAILFEFAKRGVGADKATLFSVDREHGTKMLQVNKGLITRLLDWVDNPISDPEATELSTATEDGQDPLPSDSALGGDTQTVPEN